MQTLWTHVSKTASLDSRYDFIDSGCSSCCPSYWPFLWPVLRRRQTGQTTTDKNSFLRRKFTFDSDDIPFPCQSLKMKKPYKQGRSRLRPQRSIRRHRGPFQAMSRHQLLRAGRLGRWPGWQQFVLTSSDMLLLQEEVCRYRTKSECEPRSQEVCQQVNFPIIQSFPAAQVFGRRK